MLLQNIVIQAKDRENNNNKDLDFDFNCLYVRSLLTSVVFWSVLLEHNVFAESIPFKTLISTFEESDAKELVDYKIDGAREQIIIKQFKDPILKTRDIEANQLFHLMQHVDIFRETLHDATIVLLEIPNYENSETLEKNIREYYTYIIEEDFEIFEMDLNICARDIMFLELKLHSLMHLHLYITEDNKDLIKAYTTFIRENFYSKMMRAHSELHQHLFNLQNAFLTLFNKGGKSPD